MSYYLIFTRFHILNLNLSTYIGYNMQSSSQINGVDAAPRDSKMIHELWAKHADATLPRMSFFEDKRPLELC